MLPILGVAMDSVLIDAILALIALAVGFFSAVWYIGNSTQSANASDEDGDQSLAKKQQENETERARMAAQQLRDLAANVASDVGAHNTLMTGISCELGAIDSESADSNAAVVAAVAKILAANEKLQTRLEDAESKIQTQAEEIQAQQSEARTDSLTNLANRRAFDDAMQNNLSAYERENRPFSLMIFDVDHFKKFNDTHGHQAGDEVLRKVGQTMTQVVKTNDLACRYGGEEFALVMPNTHITEAKIGAERVRKAIEEMTVEFEGKTLRVTASTGVAEISEEDDSIKLIRRSDDSVYASKEAGRNCGYWHDGEVCLPMDVDKNPEKETSDSAESTPSSDENEKAPSDPPAFYSELQRRIAESHRFGVSLSALHIHVKNFENLGKEYGSAAGQLLLDSVAQFVRTSLRDMDLLGNLEPGNFAVMLPGSTEREATMVASRIRSAISNCVIPLGTKKLKLEITVGISIVQPDDTAESMIARALEHAAPAEKAAAVQ